MADTFLPSGDVTPSSIPSSALQNSGVTASSYTSADITVNDKGIITAASNGSGGSGVVVQIVNTQTGEVATGTTQIPFDNTIPQKTEGDEYITKAITPTNASNILYIDVELFFTVTTTPWVSIALFQDTADDALAATAVFVNLSTSGGMFILRHKMIADTTSSTTFKIRAGPSNAATVTFNGASGTRIFGGVMASSITITEVTP